MSKIYLGTEDSVFIHNLTPSGVVAELCRLRVGGVPSFLAFREGGKVLDVVREGADEIVSFSLEGAVSEIGRVSAPGGPCHLHIDQQTKSAIASCYGSGHALHYARATLFKKREPCPSPRCLLEP